MKSGKGDGKEVKVVRWYKNHFVHNDLVPNEQEKEAIMHDKKVIVGMLSH